MHTRWHAPLALKQSFFVLPLVDVIQACNVVPTRHLHAEVEGDGALHVHKGWHSAWSMRMFMQAMMPCIAMPFASHGKDVLELRQCNYLYHKPCMQVRMAAAMHAKC